MNDDYTVWDLNSRTCIDSGSFLSKGRATPFEGMPVWGKCIATFVNGKQVY